LKTVETESVDGKGNISKHTPEGSQSGSLTHVLKKQEIKLQKAKNAEDDESSDESSDDEDEDTDSNM
jgi:hypothetical protein